MPLIQYLNASGDNTVIGLCIISDKHLQAHNDRAILHLHKFDWRRQAYDFDYVYISISTRQ